MSPPALEERLDPAFSSTLSPSLVADLESAGHTAIGVDSRLLIRYLNPGWYEFQQLTGQAVRQWIGDYLCGGFLEPEKSLHTRSLMECLELDRGWSTLCECACSDAYRLYRLEVTVVGGGSGLILRYPLARELVHDAEPHSVDTGHFVDPYDIALQCPQCNRFMSTVNGTWAWIQDWISAPPPVQSRAFCPVCIENYYPGG